jgi:hypothetical protein
MIKNLVKIIEAKSPSFSRTNFVALKQIIIKKMKSPMFNKLHNKYIIVINFKWSEKPTFFEKGLALLGI